MKESLLNEPVEIRLARAKNPKSASSDLIILSRDSFWLVRDFVARNPNTPDDVLQILVKDKDWRIRDGVLRNPNYHRPLDEVIDESRAVSGSDINTLGRSSKKVR